MWGQYREHAATLACAYVSTVPANHWSGAAHVQLQTFLHGLRFHFLERDCAWIPPTYVTSAVEARRLRHYGSQQTQLMMRSTRRRPAQRALAEPHSLQWRAGH